MKNFFSSPAASFFALLIAVASINAWQLVLPNFSYDNSFSVAAAKNIYEGKGYTVSTVSADHLSFTYYEPLNKWPPGYSWLLVVVKKITGADWVIACYILNAIGVTGLMLAIRKILLLLKLPLLEINIYLVYAGFVPYPFLSFGFTDLNAVALFMWAIFFLMHMIIENRRSFLYSIAAALMVGYCAYLKYLYLPVSLIPFVFLLFYAVRMNKMLLAKSLSAGSVVLITGIIYLLWFQYHHSGSAVYVNPTGKGFFPEHLLHIGPVVPGSFINFKFYDMQLWRILNMSYLEIKLLWQLLNIILVIGIMFLAFRYYKKYGLDISRPLNVYMLLALAVSTSIFLELAYLSLTQGHFVNSITPFWTYVQELRYYGVVLIFIQQGILFLVVYKRELLRPVTGVFIAIIVIVAFSEISHGAYFLCKQALLKQEIGKNRRSEQLDILAMKIARDLKQKGNKVIVCSDNDELANIASLSGSPVLYDFEKLNDTLRSRERVTLVTVLSKKVLPFFKPFFIAHQPRFLAQYDNFYFYVTDIQ